MFDKTLVNITIQKLADKIAALPEGGKCDFFIEKNGARYSATRQRAFDPHVVMIDRYGGGHTYIIEIWSEETEDQVYQIRNGLVKYIGNLHLGELFVEPEDAWLLEKSDEILPCPFCGGEAILMGGGGYDATVKCLECRTLSGTFDEKEDAISAWNRRVVRRDQATEGGKTNECND